MATHNPLDIYEPLARNESEAKALREMNHPRVGYGYAGGYFYDYGAYYEGTAIDYRQKVGDFTTSSLPMSAVRWLGNTLPEAPVLVKEPGRKEGEAQAVPDHKLVSLIRKPNDYYAGDNLWTAFAFSWITNGNVYFIKVRNGFGQVVELWYEPHWSMRPRWVGDRQGGYQYGEADDPNAFINYYELDREGRKYRLEVGDVIHFRDGIDPKNPRLGWSYIGAVLREIYGDNELSNYSARLFGGSGIPPFFIKIDPAITGFDAEQAKGLEEMAYRKTVGDGKGRPMVVWGGEPIKLAWRPDEMDLKANHRFSEERFCAVTGIPPEVLELGVGKDHSIYNNVKQADERAYYSYLIPLHRRIASQLNVQLLPDFEKEGSKRYVVHDLANVRALQEDETEKRKRVWGDYTNRVIDLAEARSKTGMSVEGWMKRYFFEREKGGYLAETAGQPKPQNPSDQTPPVKGLPDGKPSEKEIDEAVGWWDAHAPEGARGVLDARVVGNGNGAKRG